MKKRLLLCSDFACSTGFARVAENLAARLDPEMWDIHVLAVNYFGDAHPLQRKYKIYRANHQPGDPYGYARIGGLVAGIKPDLVVIQNDSWIAANLAQAITDMGQALPPTLAYIPVDSPNQKRADALNGRFTRVLTPTAFGLRELRTSGFTGDGAVLPYGVDRTIYRKTDKAEARKALKMPPHVAEGFVVGRADRNAKRKRLDLMLDYWAAWWKEAGRPEDAWLMLHCSLEDTGWDLPQLATYLGIFERVMFTAGRHQPTNIMLPEKEMPIIYNCWDVHFSTAVAEGFGLTALESAACGVEQILPAHSAYADWAFGAARFVSFDQRLFAEERINAIHYLPDRRSAIACLDDAYHAWQQDDDDMAGWALARANEARFDWDNIAETFAAHCREVIALGPPKRQKEAA